MTKKNQSKNVQTSHNSFLVNLLDSLIFSSYEFLLPTQTLILKKYEIFYKVEFTFTQNQRWKQFFCKINLGGPLYPIFFHFKVLSLLLITGKTQK